MFARVRTVMLATFRVVAFAVDRFEVPVTFSDGRKTPDDTLSIVTLVVERFEVPVTFMAAAKRLTAFITSAFPLV